MNEQDFVQAEARRRINADIEKRIKVHKANIERTAKRKVLSTTG